MQKIKGLKDELEAGKLVEAHKKLHDRYFDSEKAAETFFFDMEKGLDKKI